MSNMEDNGCVEVFEDVESKNSIIVPPISSVLSMMTKSKRRWRVAKNLALAVRRTNSLTKNEELFLKQVQTKVGENFLPSVTEDDELSKARNYLSERIAEKGENLTSTEKQFLLDLMNMPNVSASYLLRSSKVIFRDPLFSEEEKKEERHINVGTLSSPSQKICFRNEVWMQYQHCSLKDKIMAGLYKQCFPEEPKEENSKPKSPKKGLISKILKRKKKKYDKSNCQNDNEGTELKFEFSILGTCADDKECEPHVLSPPMMDALRSHLPFSVKQDHFWLKYSLVRDGSSMRVLLDKVRSSARTIIAIETVQGDVFGSFTSSPWRPRGKDFYGSCEAFLWRMKKSRFTHCNTVDDQIELEADLEVFPWSGKNRNVQYFESPDGKIIIGGGLPDNDKDQDGGFGLLICPDMFHGFSNACHTFASPALPTINPLDAFEIANMEVWTLTPVTTIENAEKLELGRQFIFDHGKFTQEI